MPSALDPYRLLNVPLGAGVEEIRAAFRRAALQYHPDSGREDPILAAGRFREVCHAYRLLMQMYGPVVTPQQLARQDEPWLKFRLPRQSWWHRRHDWQATDVPAVAREVRPRVDEPVVFALCLAAGAALAGAIVQCIRGFDPAAPPGSLPGQLLLAAAIYLAVAAATYVLLVASRTVVHILSHLCLGGRRLLPRPPAKLPGAA